MAGMSGGNSGSGNFFERMGMDKPGIQRRLDAGSKTQSQPQNPKNTIVGVNTVRPLAKPPAAGGNQTIGSSGQKLGA